MSKTPKANSTAIPKGMVRRRISPSFPSAPHMDAAKAIFMGDEMEPTALPTAMPLTSREEDTSKQVSSSDLEFAKQHYGSGAVAGEECARPAPRKGANSG